VRSVLKVVKWIIVVNRGEVGNVGMELLEDGLIEYDRVNFFLRDLDDSFKGW